MIRQLCQLPHLVQDSCSIYYLQHCYDLALSISLLHFLCCDFNLIIIWPYNLALYYPDLALFWYVCESIFGGVLLLECENGVKLCSQCLLAISDNFIALHKHATEQFKAEGFISHPKMTIFFFDLSTHSAWLVD